MIRQFIHVASICGVCLLATVFAVLAQDTAVPWSPASPISWQDFRCSPPANATRLSEVAAIHMTIQWRASYVIRSQGGMLSWAGTIENVAVSNTMDPTLSWVIRSRASDDALRHEECHFDLNEVYRRKVAAELSCIRAEGRSSEEVQSSLEQKLHETASGILERLTQMHAIYDEQTAHGTGLAAQMSWEGRVSAWLDAPMTAP